MMNKNLCENQWKENVDEVDAIEINIGGHS